MKNEHLRSLPSVDKLLNVKGVQILEGSFGRPLVTEAVRNVLNIERANLLQSNSAQGSTYNELAIKIEEWLQTETSLTLQPVINATGVILHTNLGRAPLSKEAQEAILTISKDYNTLEYDLDLGQRGPRGADVDNLICQTTGSEAALVVNNNAAAVVLILKALAERRGVVISRGQLVEIGGGFRIPDVIKQSEVNLVEVGTTNRTHPHDYHQAIREQHNNVALIMRAHHSNYNIVGFATEPNLQELVSIGLEHNKEIICGIIYDPIKDEMFVAEKGQGSYLNNQRMRVSARSKLQNCIITKKAGPLQSANYSELSRYRPPRLFVFCSRGYK